MATTPHRGRPHVFETYCILCQEEKESALGIDYVRLAISDAKAKGVKHVTFGVGFLEQWLDELS